MHQRDLIRRVWKAAGLYDDTDAKLRAFLRLIDEPAECWPGMIDACRRGYAEYKARVARPILACDDKLVHLTLIRAIDPSARDEVTLLEEYVAASEPVRDEIELRAIALKNVPSLNTALKKKRALPASIGKILATTVPAS